MTRRAIVLKRGNSLFQKALGVRFSCAVIPVSTPDFRTRILPWAYAPIHKVFTPSLPASVQHDAGPCRPGLHTLKSFFSRNPLVWMRGFGLKPTRGGRRTCAHADPLWLQTTDDSFWGEWLPTKEDPEKENSMRIWVGGGEGKGKQLEGQVEMVFSLSECLSKLTTYCVVV